MIPLSIIDFTKNIQDSDTVLLNEIEGVPIWWGIEKVISEEDINSLSPRVKISLLVGMKINTLNLKISKVSDKYILLTIMHIGTEKHEVVFTDSQICKRISYAELKKLINI